MPAILPQVNPSDLYNVRFSAPAKFAKAIIRPHASINRRRMRWLRSYLLYSAGSSSIANMRKLSVTVAGRVSYKVHLFMKPCKISSKVNSSCALTCKRFLNMRRTKWVNALRYVGPSVRQFE